MSIDVTPLIALVILVGALLVIVYAAYAANKQ